MSSSVAENLKRKEMEIEELSVVFENVRKQQKLEKESVKKEAWTANPGTDPYEKGCTQQPVDVVELFKFFTTEVECQTPERFRWYWGDQYHDMEDSNKKTVQFKCQFLEQGEERENKEAPVDIFYPGEKLYTPTSKEEEIEYRKKMTWRKLAANEEFKKMCKKLELFVIPCIEWIVGAKRQFGTSIYKVYYLSENVPPFCPKLFNIIYNQHKQLFMYKNMYNKVLGDWSDVLWKDV